MGKKYLVTCCVAILLILVQTFISQGIKIDGLHLLVPRPVNPPHILTHLLNPVTSNNGGDSSRAYDDKPRVPQIKETNKEHAKEFVENLERFLDVVSDMPFLANKDAKEHWGSEIHDLYSDQVYNPDSSQPVWRDLYVRECVNLTLGEYTKSKEYGNRATLMMEVIQSCEQYYDFLSRLNGMHSLKDQSRPEEPKSREPETQHGAEADATGTSSEGFVLGPSMADVHLHFNNSDDERWWNKSRNHYLDQVYYMRYSQPVSRDVFVGDCTNLTLGSIEPSENETVHETESRVMVQVVHQMCIEQYRRYLSQANRESFSHDDRKLQEHESEMMRLTGAAVTRVAQEALVSAHLGSAMSDMHFRFNNSDEERWWSQNRHRYSGQLYYWKYDQPVSRDSFVRDCVNLTVTKYTEPTGNQTVNEMETNVVTHIVREMCRRQFHLASGVALLLANPSLLLTITLFSYFLILATL